MLYFTGDLHGDRRRFGAWKLRWLGKKDALVVCGSFYLAGEIRDMLLRHARLQVRWRGEYQGIREMRKHLAWYTAGLPHSAALRNDGNQAETLEDFCGLIQRRW